MRSSSDGITDLRGQKDLKDVRIRKNVFHIIIFGCVKPVRPHRLKSLENKLQILKVLFHGMGPREKGGAERGGGGWLEIAHIGAMSNSYSLVLEKSNLLN